MTFTSPAPGNTRSTGSLADRLAADLRPLAPHARGWPLGPAALLGLMAAAVLVLAGGLRADLPAAVTTLPFWVKLAVAAWIAGGALFRLDRAGRPGSPSLAWRWVIAPPLVLLTALALAQLTMGGGGAGFWLGGSWNRCAPRIVLLALPVAIVLVRASGQLAPTRICAAGTALGVAAGAIAAGAYSLSCVEVSAGFVMLWYSLGIGVSALLGRLLAPGWLRW